MIDIAYRRASERRPMTAPATLVFEGSEMVACSTINVSSGGLKLLLASDVALPGEFRVSVPSARVRNRRARMVWRNGNELGIRFV
jgi:hypothetical protein